MCNQQSRGILGMVVPLALGMVTGGAGFALAPWFGSTATAMLLGGASAAGIAGGKPSNWLTKGALGALSGAGGAAMGRGAVAGWGAAKEGGAGLLGKAGGALQGAITGTAGSGANKISLISQSGKGAVGLLGPSMGTLGSLATGGALLSSGMNAMQSMTPTQQQQKTQQSYSMYAPTQYYGTSTGISNVQGIKPNTLDSWSSANEQKSNLFDRYGNNFNTLIPGYSQLVS